MSLKTAKLHHDYRFLLLFFLKQITVKFAVS